MAPSTRATGIPSGPRNQRATRYRRVSRAVGRARPGADPVALPSAATDTPDSRIMLALDDLLWHRTSEDHAGRITLGLLASPRSIGVLLDDNGRSLGLRLSRAEAQDLHRTLVTWLATTEPAESPW